MASPFFPRVLLGLALLWPVQAIADPVEQVPKWTRDGQLNLTHEWIEHGGARLYWNSLQTPLQVRLVGMRFKDPADRPFLILDEESVKKPTQARSHRKGHRARRSARPARPARASSHKPEKKPAHTSAKLDVKRDKPASQGRSRGNLAPLKPVPPVGVPLQ